MQCNDCNDKNHSCSIIRRLSKVHQYEILLRNDSQVEWRIMLPNIRSRLEFSEMAGVPAFRMRIARFAVQFVYINDELLSCDAMDRIHIKYLPPIEVFFNSIPGQGAEMEPKSNLTKIELKEKGQKETPFF